MFEDRSLCLYFVVFGTGQCKGNLSEVTVPSPKKLAILYVVQIKSSYIGTGIFRQINVRNVPWFRERKRYFEEKVVFKKLAEYLYEKLKSPSNLEISHNFRL